MTQVRVHPEIAPPATGRWVTRKTAAAAPFVLTLAIGLWGIKRQDGIWDDEAVPYDAAHRSIPRLFHLLPDADLVHGLYYLLMHIVFSVHDGLVALRLPSVLAMCATAAGVALIGDRLAGPRAGLLAGLVFPLPPVTQWSEQDGRSYAIVCALVTWSTWLLLRAVDEDRARTWAGYALVSLVACLVHEFAVLALVAHGATLLLSGVRGRPLRLWSLLTVAVLVVLAPFAVLSMGQSEQISWITTPGLRNLYDFPWLMAIGVAGALARPAKRGAVRLWALAVPMLLLPTTLLLLVTFTVKPLYVDRYVLYSVIGFALPAGAALDRLWTLAERTGLRRVWEAVGIAAIAVIIGVMLVPHWRVQRTPAARDDDLAAAARAVRTLASPGTGVLFVPERLRVTAQVFPDDFRGLTDLALEKGATVSGTRYGVELPPDRIRERIAAAGRIIVLSDDPPRDQTSDRIPQETVKTATLRAGLAVCGAKGALGVRITVYARPGAC